MPVAFAVDSEVFNGLLLNRLKMSGSLPLPSFDCGTVMALGVAYALNTGHSLCFRDALEAIFCAHLFPGCLYPVTNVCSCNNEIIVRMQYEEP